MRHGHDLDHQARPPRKVLGALAFACLGVVLLPCKARLLPASVDGIDDVLAQPRVQITRRLLEGAILGGEALRFGQHHHPLVEN